MSYEKDSIRIHVETHFLTLDSYGRMYERKRIQRLEAEKKEEKVKESIGVKDATNQNQEEDHMNHNGVISVENGAEESRNEEKKPVLKKAEEGTGHKKVLSKSEPESDDLDELNKSLAKLAESVVGKKKAEVKIQDLKHQSNDFHKLNGNSSNAGREVGNEKFDEIENVVEKKKDVEGEPESQRKLSIESPTGKEGKDDVFVYLCPFPACDFSTDFEVGLSFYQVSSRFLVAGNEVWSSCQPRGGGAQHPTI